MLNGNVYDYKKGDFQGLRSILQNIDFSNTVEGSTNVNMAWQEWKEKFVVTVREFIPTRKIKGKLSPPWITGDVLRMIRKKEERRKEGTTFDLSLLAWQIQTVAINSQTHNTRESNKIL